MPNPGIFHGKRKDFLVTKRALFDTAVERNQVPETLLQIYRAFLKRFPLDLADDIEPTDEELAAVDDYGAEPEPELGLDDLSGEALDAAMESLREKQALLEAKKGQIKRWFYYRYMRDHALDPRSTDPSNPYNALLLQATGISSDKRPRCKTPAHIWCKEPANSKRIQDEFDKIISTIVPKHRAAKRAEIANSLFKQVSEAEKRLYAERAKREHEEALKKWNECVAGRIPTAPVDRQRCISGCVQFMQPILDRLSDATGFKWTLIGGGPEPAADGRLNVISMHSGATNGAIPLNFGQAERDWYSKSFLPVYGRFLRSCYTPEECRNRALVATDLEGSLQSAAMELEGAEFHSLGFHNSVDSRLPSTAASTSMTGCATSSEAPPAGTIISSTPTATAATTTSDAVANNVADSTDPRQGGAEKDSPPNDTAALASATAQMLDEVTESLARDISAATTPCGSPIPTPVQSRGPSPIPEHEPSGNLLNPTQPKQLSRDDPNGTPAPSNPSSKRAAVDDAVTPSKRSRQTVDLSNLILPSDAPSWIKSATQMLQRGKYGESWQALIAAWLVYEGQSSFSDKSKLLAKGRPKVIAEWIKYARKPTYSPKPLPNLVLIQREHMAWWSSLQPAWRRQDDGAVDMSATGGDWECLQVFGVNGLLSVLASLYFWGMSLEHTNANRDAWDNAVSDCYFVVRALTSSSLL